MAIKTKPSNPDAVTLRDCLGTTALSTVNGLCTVFMSSLFMQYMTDYAGLGAMGAALATSLLLFARIFDAVDDPLQGFIMDRGRRTKIGKYKPFSCSAFCSPALAVFCFIPCPPPLRQSPC